MSNTPSQTNELRLVSYCPVCETRSNSMNAQTLGREGETHLMHIRCHKCENAFLTLTLANAIGATSVGLFTDLAFEDVMKFREDRSISVNDVIAMHTMLEQGFVPSCFISIPKKTVKTERKRVKRNIKI